MGCHRRSTRDGRHDWIRRPRDENRRFAPEICRAILDLKAEHPALKNYEITTICFVPFDHRPSPLTVERILAANTLSPPATRRYPPYYQIPDSVERRLVIVHLHSEGWRMA